MDGGADPTPQLHLQGLQLAEERSAVATMYTLRDIQQEELQIEKYLEIDKLPPGLHKRMKELDDR